MNEIPQYSYSGGDERSLKSFRRKDRVNFINREKIGRHFCHSL
jgi:hypothetical protein